MTALALSIGGALAAVRLLPMVAPSPSDGQAALLETFGAHRVLHARLSGGFRYAPLTTSSQPPASGNSLDDPSRLLVAQLAARAERDRTAANLHAAGVARLLAGESDRGIAWLEEAVARDPARAAYKVDLGAGYLERALRGHIPLDLLRALDITDEAIARSREAPEAWSNRALILHALGLTTPATAAGQEYARREPDQRWSADLSRQMQAMPTATSQRCDDAEQQLTKPELTANETDAFVGRCPEAAREYLEWTAIPALAREARAAAGSEPSTARRALQRVAPIADAFARLHSDDLPQRGIQALSLSGAVGNRQHREDLVDGYAELATGRQLYDGDRRQEAIAHVEHASSLLRRAGSPYWVWAELLLARIEATNDQLSQALARLDAVRASAGSSPSVLAREAWLRGVVLLRRSDPAAALASYRLALAYYERLGEIENAANVANTAADTYRITGEIETGWSLLAGALSQLPRLPDPTRRYLICYNASLYSLRLGLPRAALVFQDEAVRQANMRSGPGGVVEALLNRARIHDQLRARDASTRDLESARDLLLTLPDTDQRRYMTEVMDAVHAELDITSRPRESLAAAQRAQDYFRAAEPAELPRLHGIAARAAFAMEDTTRAEAELQAGINAFEARRTRLQDELARWTYFDEGWDLYAALVDLRLKQGRADEAFAVAERSKARSLLDRLPAAAALPSSSADLARRLPARTSLVMFAQHLDQLHWWQLSAGRTTHGRVALSVSDIRRLSADFRRALEDGSGLASRHQTLEQLYEAVIRPLALDGTDLLVWIPDGPLQELPVAALRNPRTGRYLIEDLDIIAAPSARLFIDASSRLAAGQSMRTLIVGDPSFNRQIFAHVPLLREAAREAGAIARLYPDATVLSGDDATKRRVLDALGHADLVHFAGHAIGNEAVPQMSQLLLAPEHGIDEVGALYGYELSGLPLHARIVVLSACSTVSGRARPGEGAMSLARFLLGNGVATVVGTLWDIDDVAAHDISVALHRHLQSGGDPARALGAAQRELLRRQSASWAAFTVYGGVLADRGAVIR